MTTEIQSRYGGTVSAEPVPEGWRLTCSDDDGEIAVVYLSGRDAQQLVDALRYRPAPPRASEITAVLSQHRVNYHHRNVGPEPVTADNLRYTSCEGCDWLGGHRDEAGWESHLAGILAMLYRPGVSGSEVSA